VRVTATRTTGSGVFGLVPRLWLGVLLLGGLLLALNGSVLGWPFLSDDFIFLSTSRSIAQLFSSFDQFPNYFRPIGRELYFFLGYKVAGTHPLPFHLANFAILLAIVALLVSLGTRLGGPRAGFLAGAAYTLLYPHRVLMAWVSCSQDQLATLLALVAAHAMLSGRRWRAAGWHLAALLCKESVAAYPLVHTLWRIAGAPAGTSWPRRLRTAGRDSLPLWVSTLVWATLVITVRLLRHAWAKSQSTPVADVSVSAASLWEGMRSALLSYVALDQPWALLRKALMDPQQPWLALVTSIGCVVLAVALSRRLAAPQPSGESRPDAMLSLGTLWAVVGALPVALAGHHFSAYYISFSGIGFACVAGRLLATARPIVVASSLAAMASLGLAANRVDVFNLTRKDPVAGASYITIARLNDERVFLDSLQTALLRIHPERGAVVYLSYAPHYMTFATADNRAPRVWLNDPTFDLELIGHYHPETESRPHGFLRFDGTGRGFMHVPNDVMDADLASEAAMNAHQPLQARSYLERAIALLPTGSLPLVRLDLLNNHGFVCATLGDTAQARRSWRAALAIDPAFQSAVLNLARLDAEAGRLSSAREELTRFVNASPRAADVWNLLVRVQLALGDMPGAQTAFDRLAAIEPAAASSLKAGLASGSLGR
jgi:tetratricopeptide (TPR) repeat protein